MLNRICGEPTSSIQCMYSWQIYLTIHSKCIQAHHLEDPLLQSYEHICPLNKSMWILKKILWNHDSSLFYSIPTVYKPIFLAKQRDTSPHTIKPWCESDSVNPCSHSQNVHKNSPPHTFFINNTHWQERSLI